VVTSYWAPYDERMPWRHRPGDVEEVAAAIAAPALGRPLVSLDLADPDGPRRLFEAAEVAFGSVTALVLCHCESVASGVLDTTIDSLDRHFVIKRPCLVAADSGVRPPISGRDRQRAGRGVTSDDTVNNMPYGASKGALDRIVIAAARELAHLRITANVINPGPVDTGWMSDEQLVSIAEANPRGRVGKPADTAALISFLCSEDGGWINGQLLHSDGGLHA